MLASKNRGKLREIGEMLKGLDMQLLSLDDYENVPEIVEDGKTFLENALKKAQIVSEYTGEITLADDSGLEVEYLGGAPGIYSSRYSGEGATDESNIRKLLEDLRGVPIERRGAAFRCVIVLFFPVGSHEAFEGALSGVISDKPAGEAGFGYDPVFFLPDRGVTVAQLSPEVKNCLSHRARAIQKLKDYLQRDFADRETGRSAAW